MFGGYQLESETVSNLMLDEEEDSKIVASGG